MAQEGMPVVWETLYNDGSTEKRCPHYSGSM